MRKRRTGFFVFSTSSFGKHSNFIKSKFTTTHKHSLRILRGYLTSAILSLELYTWIRLNSNHTKFVRVPRLSFHLTVWHIMTRFVPKDIVKYLHKESSTLSVPVYEICDVFTNREEFESCFQYCRDKQAGLVLWKTSRSSPNLEEYVQRKGTLYTEEVSIYTIYLNVSLITCLQSRHNLSRIRCEQVDELQLEQFRIDPCVYSKTFNDPNFTRAEVQDLFCRKIGEHNADNSQYFVCSKSDQSLVGFAAIKREDIEVYNSLKFLVPEQPNEDGNLTYMFIADPYLEEKNYDIFEVLVSQYGRARAEEYFDRWITCFAYEQEVISFR